jgi:AcrR family transcriptional regulator
MTTKAYHHGDLRQSLIEATLVLLQTKDVKSLSLREVARQAGVSHTAPYRHFADKADLLATVAQEGFVAFGQALQAAVEQNQARPIDSLIALGEAYIHFALEHPAHFRVMFSHFPTGLAPDSPLSAIADGTFDILVKVIASGQTAGVIQPGDPVEMAIGRWALVHGLAMLLLDGMLQRPQTATPMTLPALIKGTLSSSLTGLLTTA